MKIGPDGRGTWAAMSGDEAVWRDLVALQMPRPPMPT